MVAQPTRLTKSPAHILCQWAIPSASSVRRCVAAAMLILLFCCASMVSPALAWVKVEPPQSVNAALVYGMKSSRLNLAVMLGDNWIEGENGSLLNVYSPFMMLSTKAAKAGFPVKPAKSDLEAARKRFARDVMYYSDTKNRFLVKFAVSFYGNSPDFAKTYSARIVGFGRGKDFNLKPEKQILDQLADAINGGQSGGNYEAINSYYFLFSELQELDEFKLQLESPNGPPLEFRMKSERLY
jgi:hypothetical protein